MRYKSLLAATGLLASGLAFAQPAQAAPAVATAVTGPTAGSCSINLPAKLYVKAPRNEILVTTKADCAASHMKSASWDGTHVNDPVTESVEFPDPNPTPGQAPTTSKLTIFDDTTPIGRLDWEGTGALDVSNNDLTQPNYVSTTKFDSWANVVTSKSGTTVSVTGQIGYYYSKANRYIRWPKKTGILQFAEKGSTTWHNLSSFTANSNGEYTVKYKPGKVRQYRLYVYESATVWDKLSPTKSQ